MHPARSACFAPRASRRLATALLALLAGFGAIASSPTAATAARVVTDGGAAPSVVAAPAAVGPGLDVVRPAPAPLDLRAAPLAKGVERAWLQKDVELVWSLRSALPPSTSAASLLARLRAAGGSIEARDLGQGVTRHQARFGAGYTSCTVTAASHGDALLAARVECYASSDPATLDAIRPTLERAMGPAFTRDPAALGGLSYSLAYDVPGARASLAASLARDLGPLEATGAPAPAADVAAAYALLTSPLDELTIGTACGIVGVAPAGRGAIDTLRAAGRVDLLRDALRGPNPEGRAYAARALADLGALRPSDAAIVARLAASREPLRVCDGCLFSERRAAEVLHSRRP